MTKSEKAAATLRANKEKQRARAAEQKAEREAIHAVLMEIINDPTSTNAERLHAAELLLNGN